MALASPPFLGLVNGLQEPFKSSLFSTSFTCPLHSGPTATEPLRPKDQPNQSLAGVKHKSVR